MKLYRGLKSTEYKEFNKILVDALNNDWIKVLRLRDRGDFKYPSKLNSEIINLHKHQSLGRQFFTDNKKVATRYAKDNDGIVVKVDVPLKHVVEHFVIEVQNYSKRQENFELVYVVNGVDLFNHALEWRLTVS